MKSSRWQFRFLRVSDQMALALALVMSLQTVASPNVIFIAVDDLNDWIGCLGGHPQAITPHLDRLAQRGILFTNAHCVAPACRPSRSAVFSGQLPQQTGAWSNQSPDIIKDLPEGSLLPHYLVQHGYATLGTGKLFHGGGTEFFQSGYQTEQRWSPFTRQQVNYTEEELPSKGSQAPRHLVSNGPGGHDYMLPINGLPSERNPEKISGESFDWGAFEVEDSAMGDVRITDWAMSQLTLPQEKPFFLGVGYYRPHIPLFAPGQDFAVYPPVKDIQLPTTLANDLHDLGPTARKWALEPITAGSHRSVKVSGQWRQAVRAYLACVTFVDRQIGRLLQHLEQSSHAHNTWIVLWGDHGWHLGEKQHWGKWTGWRAATRVPLIIVPPLEDRLAVRNQSCDSPVSLLDLYPTILDLCRVPPREELAGKSLLPLVRDPGIRTKRQVMTMFDRGNIAISGHAWRYIQYADGEEELYHIAKDPHEWHNLAGMAPYRSKLLRFRLEAQVYR
ncbi:MAG: sulfatase [Verrucomicrobiota bacterium]|nr:sulfatase [Verrucomicrobiota bacterium]